MNISRFKMAALIGASLILASAGAQAGIKGSKHDFTSGGGAQDTSGPEICVFCHTPHGSNTLVQAPLWNKPVATAGAYNAYSSTTLDAKTAIGSVSLACLSCHDGQQAMDSVINAPGSGRYNNTTGTNIGGNQTMGGTPIPNLGTDLSNDHPVSIQYAGGGCVAGGSPSATPADANCTFKDPDFNTVTTALIGTTQQWWVNSGKESGGASTARTKTDIILYRRVDDFAAGTTEPSVECASCHDPHNAASAATNVSPAFMRFQNTNSDLCLTCHDK